MSTTIRPSETTAVRCPYCERETAIAVPHSGGKPHIKRSVALFGEHVVVECSDGHVFRVYFC